MHWVERETPIFSSGDIDEGFDLVNDDEMKTLAPAGYYLAIRVGFAFPLVEQNHLPEGWVKEYTASGLLMHDPAMAWAYRNTGVTRLKDLGENDTQGVLELAKNYGLNFGAVASCSEPDQSGQRSFGFFFRSDRDYSEGELERLHASLAASHIAHARPKNLTNAELETLSLVKNGVLMKEMACLLGISESAIKQRLKNARLKLNAKTGSQAAATATMLGMI
jgi:LuxR family transcriptional regulator, quorum-sensing system regulator SdiA